MSAKSVGSHEPVLPAVEQLVDVINHTHALTESYTEAQRLKLSLEALVLKAQHIVPAPAGLLFEVRYSKERYPVGVGRCFGDGSELSGIRASMRTTMTVGPETEPFYADKLAVLRGVGTVAVDRLYNFRGFDTQQGDIVELIEAPPTQE